MVLCLGRAFGDAPQCARRAARKRAWTLYAAAACLCCLLPWRRADIVSATGAKHSAAWRVSLIGHRDGGMRHLIILSTYHQLSINVLGDAGEERRAAGAAAGGHVPQRRRREEGGERSSISMVDGICASASAAYRACI